jgi:hypothetical protein
MQTGFASRELVSYGNAILTEVSEEESTSISPTSDVLDAVGFVAVPTMHSIVSGPVKVNAAAMPEIPVDALICTVDVPAGIAAELRKYARCTEHLVVLAAGPFATYSMTCVIATPPYVTDVT